MNVTPFSEDNIIVKMYAGSLAYGTNLPTSDVDVRGIFVAPAISIRTPFFPIYEQSIEQEEDTKYYELNKFMQLALDCNPNVIELLWTEPSDITYATPAYDLLRAAAPQLLSSKIAFTTSGYAISQLKRIKGHNKWIMNPQPEEAPQQVDYVSLVHNFTGPKTFKIRLRDLERGHRLVPFSGDTYGVYPVEGYSPFNSKTGNLNVEYEGDSHDLGTPLYVIKFNRSVYEGAKDTWKNYWDWKKHRNVARSTLEEQFGYDTKHAMHLVRLLRMGVEALEDGVINVRRVDAEELLSIRNGAWTYEEVVEYAEEMDNKVRNVLYPTTQLRKKPDVKLAAELIITVQDIMWTKN